MSLSYNWRSRCWARVWRWWARCHHKSRRLGLPCFRTWVYDYWCGKHNGSCWHHNESNRCRREEPRDK